MKARKERSRVDRRTLFVVSYFTLMTFTPFCTGRPAMLRVKHASISVELYASG